jgi:hypothetical protein
MIDIADDDRLSPGVPAIGVGKAEPRSLASLRMMRER